MPPVGRSAVEPTGSNDRGRLDGLVKAAQAGDGGALAALVDAVADDVYRLALRMLWHPQDAEDASQEALVRIVTGLGSFRGEASFRTWSYRVAVNHYLNVSKSRVERERLTFDAFAQQLLDGLEENPATQPDSRLLAEELRPGTAESPPQPPRDLNTSSSHCRSQPAVAKPVIPAPPPPLNWGKRS